mmetsp:Transcript_40411/g.79084  ORF Transcript_40411/g.79084 Transcript_40411/m.79084 type:complete len:207 (+) Transcript_40411:346-966(+)
MLESPELTASTFPVTLQLSRHTGPSTRCSSSDAKAPPPSLVQMSTVPSSPQLATTSASGGPGAQATSLTQSVCPCAAPRGVASSSSTQVPSAHVQKRTLLSHPPVTSRGLYSPPTCGAHPTEFTPRASPVNPAAVQLPFAPCVSTLTRPSLPAAASARPCPRGAKATELTLLSCVRWVCMQFHSPWRISRWTATVPSKEQEASSTP